MPNAGLPNLSKVGRCLWDRYGTPEKLENARRLTAQTAACEETVSAYPWRVILEPTNVCNLRCDGCCTADQTLPKGLLELENLERFLSELWPFLVQVNLFNAGEPFLHPRLPRIIDAIHRHDVGTHIHTNMNRLPAGLASTVIDAGLDFLVASIDGVTQAVYARFRTGGSCRDALRNLEAFVQARDAKDSSWPRIIWRFLCFPHNLHEIEEAERLAREIGVDDFALAPGHLHGQHWTPEGPKPAADGCAGRQPPYCTDLYDFPAIHWNGSVLPCCLAADSLFVWGDLTTSTWHEAFNSEPFRAARRLASGDPSAESPCAECDRIPKPIVPHAAWERATAREPSTASPADWAGASANG